MTRSEDPKNVGGGGRVSREDAERTRPFRGWMGMLRPWDTAPRGGASGGGQTGGQTGAAGNGARTAAGGNGEGSWQSVVDRGVELGYKVIDEQIRQGQRAAQEFGRQSYGPQSVNRDLQELVSRTMRYYVDMAGLWMDLLGSVPRSVGAAGNPFGAGSPWSQWSAPWSGRSGGPWNPYGAPGPSPADPPPPASPPEQPEEREEPELSIRLSRAARVKLDLEPGAAGGALSVPSLVAAGGAVAAIDSVEYEPAGAGQGPALLVEIPEDQPAGVYCGVIFDVASGEPRGTLRIELAGPQS